MSFVGHAEVKSVRAAIAAGPANRGKDSASRLGSVKGSHGRARLPSGTQWQSHRQPAQLEDFPAP